MLASDLIKYHLHYIKCINKGLFDVFPFCLIRNYVKTDHDVSKSFDIAAQGTYYSTLWFIRA